ncbi:GNAT family N-acetyltransferase [Yinghuangia aomiensis]
MTTPSGSPDDRPAARSDIAWRRATEADFPLLREWLEHDYVARWWNHETSPEAVARDFGASARGEEPSEDWLALRGARPFGLVQRCRVADYPEYADDLAGIVAVPVGAANRRSWRALEKAGFTRAGECDLEPDNPIDEPLHYVYRLDRPSGQ